MLNYKEYIVKHEGWTARITIDPFAIPLTEILARTPVTPNQVTIFSFLLSLVSAYFFFIGGQTHFVWGAVIWHISSIFDGVDGMLARKTDRTSPFGAKLDNGLDKVKKVINLGALVYALRDEHSVAVMAVLLIIHYTVHYIKVKPNRRIENFLHSIGIKSLFDPLDEQWFLIFIGPIFGKFFLCLVIIVGLQIINKLFYIFCGISGQKNTEN